MASCQRRRSSGNGRAWRVRWESRPANRRSRCTSNLNRTEI